MRSRIGSLIGICVLLLLALGFVVLFSASAQNAERLHGGNSYAFLIRQLQWLAVSVVAMVVAMFFDYHNWRKYPAITVAGYCIVVVLMVAVLFAPEIKGSRRWLMIGGMGVQPSEFAKMLAVISIAVFLDRVGWRINLLLKGALPAVGIVGLLAGLAVLEPDFGATMVIGLAGGVLLFVAGMRKRHLGMFIGGAVGCLSVLVYLNPNRMMRLRPWIPDTIAGWLGLGPVAENDPALYQLQQALVAIGNGGIAGSGFLESKQKLLYLPEAHTDFIFAIGAEEFGIAFSIGLLLLYVLLFCCGLYVSYNAPDRLGRLIAYGMSFLLFFQVIFNLFVVSGLVPTKGIALPFISYGGTNLLSAMMIVGVLLNVARQIGLPNSMSRSRIAHVFSNKGENENVASV